MRNAEGLEGYVHTYTGGFCAATAAVGPRDVIAISHVSLTVKGIYERVGRPIREKQTRGVTIP